jgi:C-terminal processing protease CtpA/Prc
MLPDGTELEGKGVAPDITVKATPTDLEASDPVLDEGLKQLRGSR